MLIIFGGGFVYFGLGTAIKSRLPNASSNFYNNIPVRPPPPAAAAADRALGGLRDGPLDLRDGLLGLRDGPRRRTKIVQGWPKLRASFRALIGIFSQSVGPSLAIWANPVQFSCRRTRTTGGTSVP